MASKQRVHVGVRLDQATIARIDAIVEQLSTEWHEATRSEVLRMLINVSLARLKSDPEGLRRLLPLSRGAEEETGRGVVPVSPGDGDP